MRKYWFKIGLGAATVFAAGMFSITLGRQVKSAAAEALRSGSSIRVPLAMLPFTLDGEKVGTVRQIQIDRSGPKRVKHVNVTVRLKGVTPDALEECALTVSRHSRHELFQCIAIDGLDLAELVRVGEVRFEPSGLVRPILLERDLVEDWFDLNWADLGLRPDSKADIEINGEDGSLVRLHANEDGALLK
ncbi:MAG: hypothetical protein E4G90_12165, partial [Gemmatimonadales bacterium]